MKMETECLKTATDISRVDSSNNSPDSKSNMGKEDDFLTAEGELNFPRLKKRKKKIPFVSVLEETENYDLGKMQSEDLDQVLENLELQTTPLANPQPLKVNQESNILDTDMNFEGLKKKKKKATKIILESSEDILGDGLSENTMQVADRLMCINDDEYTYDYLLSRFYQIVSKDRPESEIGTAKITLKPPLIFRVGSKKTSFANFVEICKLLHRPPPHFMSYLLVELGTSGSLDGNNHLIIKGRFQQKQIESIIRRYIKDYVRCATCNSHSTLLQKEIRLTFLRCENCGSRRSVASIKTGFQALTGKRAAIRAKSDK